MGIELTGREEAEELYGGEDDPDLYVVHATDPGGETGWSILGIHPDALGPDPDLRVLKNVMFWSAGELAGNENDQVDELVEMIAMWPSARLVLEDFLLRKMSMGRELLAPVRISAALEWAVRPRYFVKQQSNLAFSTVDDDRLKAMGLWIPGKEHARDATKHALTFLKRIKDRAVRAGQSGRVSVGE
jgi:hypothetical protein